MTSDQETEQVYSYNPGGRTGCSCTNTSTKYKVQQLSIQLQTFTVFPSVFVRLCWLGDRNGIRPVIICVLVCWWWHFDWRFACLIAPVVTTTSITLSSNKLQNGDILVPANPGPPGKWLLKHMRERDLLFYEAAVNTAKIQWDTDSKHRKRTTYNVLHWY